MTPVSDGLWKGRGGSLFPAKHKLQNTSPSWRTLQKVTDIAAAFLSPVFSSEGSGVQLSLSFRASPPKKRKKLFHPQVFGLIYTFQLNRALGDTMRRGGGWGVLKGSLWNRVPVMQQHTGDNLTFDPAALWKWGDYLTGADNNPAVAATSKALKRTWWKEHKRTEGLEKKSLGWYIMKERVQQGPEKKRLDEQVWPKSEFSYRSGCGRTQRDRGMDLITGIPPYQERADC